MIPLIEKLKANPNFKESHWECLMKEVDVNSTNINIKFLTLQQVFDLNLHLHPDAVDEIVTMAAQESNNEDQIKQIEIYWKNTSFQILEYKKGKEKKGFVVKIQEDIVLNLNDNLITL